MGAQDAECRILVAVCTVIGGTHQQAAISEKPESRCNSSSLICCRCT